MQTRLGLEVSLALVLGLGALALIGSISCFGDDPVANTDGGSVDAGFTDSGGGRDAASEQDAISVDAEAPDSGGSGACSISAPSTIDFGVVGRERAAILHPVAGAAASGGDCILRNLRLEGDPDFTTDHGPIAAVASGAGEPIAIIYQPHAPGMHQATLRFDSSDPLQPSVQIAIHGQSEPPKLLVAPQKVDFGEVRIGCASISRLIELHNFGAAAVDITAIAVEPADWTEVTTPQLRLPINVPAGGNINLGYTFRPAATGRRYGILTLTTAAGQKFAISLSGAGRPETERVDHFVARAPAKSDVLFILDNSMSMQDERSGLAGRFTDLIAHAESGAVDYRIAATTTDVGAGGAAGQLITSGARLVERGTPNAAAAIASNFAVGVTGSGDEQGLEAMYLALSEPLAAGANAGFRRPDAAFSLVVLSDENDSSPRSTAFYRAFLISLEGPESRTALDAIVVASDPSCSIGGTLGVRYIDLAADTGGVVTTVCSADWAVTARSIGRSLFGAGSRFVLGTPANMATVMVRVNGRDLPKQDASGTHWSYRLSQVGTVDIEPASVPAGALVDVSYTAACL